MPEVTAPLAGNILVVDDEDDVRRIITDALVSADHVVEGAGDAESALELLEDGSYDLAFVDINLPGMSGFDLLERYQAGDGQTAIVIITGRATVASAIEATGRGAYDYVTKPFDIQDLIGLTERVMERQRIYRQLGHLRERTRAEFEPGVEIVGNSSRMQEVYKLIGRVASSPATVLIEGESGTGKELVAKALHAYSERWQGPFVGVNCSAIPTELLESEMFGHEKGAFTGAGERRIGRFEQASGGTLFLDEICDMPPELQAKLLRVLQEREFARVGGHETLRADCRVLAATNKDMEAEVASGRFREDLYFRLKVLVITLPPLRDRTEDIPPLVEFFIERINATHKFSVNGITPDALTRLVSHDWRGNVRELENCLLRAAALAPGRLLTGDDIPLASNSSAVRSTDPGPLDEALSATIKDYVRRLGDRPVGDLHETTLAVVERPLIEAVLERTGGNQLKAAAMLGINRNTLRKKLTELAIEVPKRRQES